jgi:hypothetical protein
MRNKIIDALIESRILVRDQVDWHDCSHGGYYSRQDGDCRSCEFEFECQWLSQNDEFVALERKATKILIDSLEFAHAYVDAIVTRRAHDRRACLCETCCWLRNTQRLLGQVRTD